MYESKAGAHIRTRQATMAVALTLTHLNRHKVSYKGVHREACDSPRTKILRSVLRSTVAFE